MKCYCIFILFKCFLVYNKKMNREEYQDFKNLRKTLKHRHSAVVLSRSNEPPVSKLELHIYRISLNKQQSSAERIHNSFEDLSSHNIKPNIAKRTQKNSRFKHFQGKNSLIHNRMETDQSQDRQYNQGILFKAKTINLKQKEEKLKNCSRRLLKIRQTGSENKQNGKKYIYQKKIFQIRKIDNKRQNKQFNEQTVNVFQQQQVKQFNRKFNEKRATRRQTYINLLAQISEHSKRDSFIMVRTQQSSSLRSYFTFLSNACSQINLSFNQIDSYRKGPLKYKLPASQNSSSLHKAMSKRWWWQKSNDLSANITFSGHSNIKNVNLSNIIKLDEQSTISSSQSSIQSYQLGLSRKSVSNFFKNRNYLTSPVALSFIMKHNKQEFSPISFYIDRYRGQNWYNFTQYFFSKIDLKENWAPGDDKRQWIVKNGQQSNLKIFKIFSNYQQIKQFIILHTKNDRSFVIQKYIDDQFLLDEQKIDIHAFILINNLNGVINSYWYDDGFIELKEDFKQRPSSAKELYFQFSKTDRPHSTKIIENKICFEDFQAYCRHLRKNQFSFTQNIVPLMKQAAKNLLLSSNSILLQEGNQSKFQIFQLKFVVDYLLKPWLISVSSLSNISAKSQVQDKLYSSLVDDSLKLSIDLIYPPPLNWPASKQQLIASNWGSTKFNLIFDSANFTPTSGKKSSDFPFFEKINQRKIPQSETSNPQIKFHTCPLL